MALVGKFLLIRLRRITLSRDRIMKIDISMITEIYIPRMITAAYRGGWISADLPFELVE